MKRVRSPGGRVLLVSVLTAFAAGAGVWAQGTEVTLTKTENEGVNLVGFFQDQTQTSWGSVSGNQNTNHQPPAPEVTTVSVSADAQTFDPATQRSCTAWGSGVVTNENAVNVGPGGTSASINADVPGAFQRWGPSPTDWTSGPAILSVRATANSDNPGPPNETTSNWYSPDRSIKTTTHVLQFQNLVTDGRIAVTADPVLAGPGCGIDVPVTAGTISDHTQSVHAQVDQ